jgi:transposase
MTVAANSDRKTLARVVRRVTEPTTHVNTDAWQGYNRLPAMHRPRSAVCHAAGEWVRDEDGDGVREAHCNTLEGLRTGLRNFLRPFREVHKKYLYQYVAMFEWSHNVERRRSSSAPCWTSKLHSPDSLHEPCVLVAVLKKYTFPACGAIS